MKRWFRRGVFAAVLIGVVGGVLFEHITHVGRGWWNGEPFYDGRPASYWADEIERWESRDAVWANRNYVRRTAWPRWLERVFPEPRWPRLLDGDRDGLAVLHELSKHPSNDVREWALIGIERIDNDERGPYTIKHPSVIVTALLYEVDEAFHGKLEKAKWLSLAELERMQEVFVAGPVKEQPGESLLALLDKEKPVLLAKNVKIDAGKEGMLLSATKEIQCLPSPAQLRKGQKGPQKIDEGMTLRVHVEVSADRRYIRAKFIEKGTELEGIDKVPLVLDAKGAPKLAGAEIACVKESTFATLRTVPDGGIVLLPLQSRPPGDKEARRLVVRIEPRIYIEAEERLIRGESEK